MFADEIETLTLEINHGEASALAYFIAFASLNHGKLTPHEKSLVEKVKKLNPDTFEFWSGTVKTMRRNRN